MCAGVLSLILKFFLGIQAQKVCMCIVTYLEGFVRNPSTKGMQVCLQIMSRYQEPSLIVKFFVRCPVSYRIQQVNKALNVHRNHKAYRDPNGGKSRMGGRGYGGVGRGRVYIYLSLHCHHQNDFCIKVGSDESHFNVS